MAICGEHMDITYYLVSITLNRRGHSPYNAMAFSYATTIEGYLMRYATYAQKRESRNRSVAHAYRLSTANRMTSFRPSTVFDCAKTSARVTTIQAPD